MDKPLLTIAETAARLGWSTSKVYRLMKAGQIPAKHVGGLWYSVGLEEWVQTRDNAPVEQPTPATPEAALDSFMPARRRFGNSAA